VITGGDSLRYLENSYEAVGNDGNHFNSNLLQGANSMYPDSIVNALYYMSDHLPVLLKAVATYPTSNGLALNPSYTPVTCYGDVDGTATITPNAGQAPYTYLWGNSTGNQTTQTATGLTSGQHCVLVTDDLGQTDSYCIYVPAPDPISLNYFVQPDDGSCDGTIYLLVEGGEEPYTFDWSGGVASDSSTAVDLCEGAYIVIITDNEGCDTTITIELGNVSTDDYESQEPISIYPNPVRNKLRVRGKVDLSTFRIVNQLGQVMNAKVEVLSEELIQVDMSSFPSGVYFLRAGEVMERVWKRASAWE